MKKFLFLLSFIFVLTQIAHSQTIDGNVKVVENNGSTYAIKIQIKLEQGSSVLGNTDIRYTFDTTGLSFPQSPVENTDYIIYNFNNGDYATAVSHPTTGSISINIAKTSGTGITISTSYIDVATIYFSILDSTATSNLQPGIIQFFSPSSTTMWSLGTWSSDNSALPVELNSFTASTSSNNVSLNWSTATEINNYGFDVERKTSKTNWSKIGFVQGNGTSNEPHNYSFSDQNLKPGKYNYRLKQLNTNGSFTYSKTIEINVNTPLKYELSQNYPNPFNPTTTISYDLPQSEKVTLNVYNMLGQKVASLVNKVVTAGHHEVQFYGDKLASGTYIYRITAGNFIQTKKMILLK